MNIWRFNYFIADYLDSKVGTDGWDWCENKGEEVRTQLHSLINSDLIPEGFLDE